MKQFQNDVSSEVMSSWVVDGMLEKKGADIAVLDLRDIKHAIADYFIICSGNSDAQMDALSDSVEEQVHKKSKQNPWKREGKENKEWILLDYVDVVAHILSKEKRKFYGLEELWGDAKASKISDN